MSNESTPQLHISGPCATITLNRPSQRNSLRDEDLQVLLQHFASINQNQSIRLCILTANTVGQHKPVFSSGYHIAGFEGANHDPHLFAQIPDALEALRPITLCAVNGSVYGGATDLMLACDLRLGLAGCELRMPANVLGLHYYPSGLSRYVSRLGLNLTKQAFLTAQAIRFETLQSTHLFNNLVGIDTFQASLKTLSEQVLALAPLSSQLTKQSLNDLAHDGYNDKVLPNLHTREKRSMQSHDFAEGRAAFAQKRPPVFTGT